jgi:hypothetical protein
VDRNTKPKFDWDHIDSFLDASDRSSDVAVTMLCV